MSDTAGTDQRSGRGVERRLTRRVPVLVAAVAIFAFAALLLGRAELAAAATGLVTPLAAGLARYRRPELSCSVTTHRRSLVEGDEIEIALSIEASGVERVGFELVGSPGLHLDVRRGSARAPWSEPIVVRASCPRWGDHHLESVRLWTLDRFGLVLHQANAPVGLRLRAYPAVGRLGVLAGGRLRPEPGVHPSRHNGSGIEFADLRPMRPGDQRRDVNWRVTARHGEPWVNDRHPDRAGSVVLLIDSFTSLGVAGGLDRVDDSTLRTAIRCAVRLARRAAASGDRVGVLDLGGTFRWLLPGAGARHLHRVVDALLDSRLIASEAERSVATLPRRALQPRSFVVALTPLLDERGIAACEDLAAAGHELVVLEVDPAPFLAPARSDWARQAERLWRRERALRRDRLRSLGMPVEVLRGEGDLEAALEALVRARRVGRAGSPPTIWRGAAAAP
ncbi:MAG: DUF58 domain-containing protein [Acidimicrobiia bacterium]|nr:DUF58 domain-containing protein [Acidimicrobiia bacterium]